MLRWAHLWRVSLINRPPALQTRPLALRTGLEKEGSGETHGVFAVFFEETRHHLQFNVGELASTSELMTFEPRCHLWLPQAAWL